MAESIDCLLRFEALIVLLLCSKAVKIQRSTCYTVSAQENELTELYGTRRRKVDGKVTVTRLGAKRDSISSNRVRILCSAQKAISDLFNLDS